MTACDPKGSDVVVKVADPFLRGDVPNFAVPAEKVTLPVGVLLPETALTWALKTVWLPSMGFFEFTYRRVVVAAIDRCETEDELLAESQPVTNSRPENVNTQNECDN